MIDSATPLRSQLVAVYCWIVGTLQSSRSAAEGVLCAGPNLAPVTRHDEGGRLCVCIGWGARVYMCLHSGIVPKTHAPIVTLYKSTLPASVRDRAQSRQSTANHVFR